MTTYHCIVLHPAESRVLLIRLGEKWSLPRVVRTDPVWFPNGVNAINQTLLKSLGIRTTVLRQLCDSGNDQFCEVESHGEHLAPGHEARWVGSNDVSDTQFAVAGHLSALQRWFSEVDAGVPPVGRPPWEKRGWYTQVDQWILSQLEKLDRAPGGHTTQFKGAWSSSSILRVPTHSEELFFKAVYAKPPSEVRLLRTLGQRWPRNVPGILACDEQRGWMLMSNFGDVALDSLPNQHWEAAASRFAEIQIEAAADIDIWTDLGCPRRGPKELSTAINRLFRDTQLLMSDGVGLSSQDVEQLQALVPQLQAILAELSDSAVPLTLHHEDFRSGNIALYEDAYVYYDWGDTAISHPFFSMHRMIDYLLPPHPTAEQVTQAERTTNAFLRIWTAYDDWPRLYTCGRLNPIYQAIRRYLEFPYLEPGCPWAKYLHRGLGENLRELLSGFERLFGPRGRTYGCP